MPFITFQPSGIAIQVETGTEFLDAARRAGVEADAPCGGKGTCGNCAVRVTSGRIVTESAGVLTTAEVEEGFVLACRAIVGTGDVTVEMQERSGLAGGQFGEGEDMGLLDPDLLPRPEDLQPPTAKILLLVKAPRKADGLSDLDRLTEALQQRLGKKEIRCELPLLREAADALRIAGGAVTVTVAGGGLETHPHPRIKYGAGSNPPLEGEELAGLNPCTTSEPPTVAQPFRAVEMQPLQRGEGKPAGVRVTAVEGGDTTDRHYGVAIDVGTTTVAVQMVNLATGQVLATGTDYNRQLACGLDVISRIDYARRPERREELTSRVLKTINRLIRQGAASCRIETRELASAVISGNTTMIHLLLGLNPEYIRLYPFIPTILAVPPLTASEIGLHIGSAAPVLISPAVGSYVGGDITAGILCTDLARGGEDVSLFMDIGTNGEVVLGNREFLLAAACSAGPAFEGGGIKCGMRAAAGAVEKVAVDPDTGRATVETIGRIKPRGICGSGMISLLAELLKTGWIDAAGKLNRNRPAEAIRWSGRRASYTLVPAALSATGHNITIDEQDIENIIRAKAAMYAACALMLAEVGMTFRDLARVYIAGGFGRFLDLADAVAIGLLPHLPPERFHFIGNASLKGSYMALVSQRHRERQRTLARRMTYLELSTTPAYMDQYTAALFLPHTDPANQ